MKKLSITCIIVFTYFLDILSNLPHLLLFQLFFGWLSIISTNFQIFSYFVFSDPFKNSNVGHTATNYKTIRKSQETDELLPIKVNRDTS